MSFSAALTCAANAGSVAAPAITRHHEGLRRHVLLQPLLLEQSSAPRIASGLFVKSKSVVSAVLSRAPDAPNPDDRITAQIPTVRHGCLLLARASVSGFSFIRSPFRQTLPKPALTYDVCLRCMGA